MRHTAEYIGGPWDGDLEEFPDLPREILGYEGALHLGRLSVNWGLAGQWTVGLIIAVVICIIMIQMRRTRGARANRRRHPFD